MLATQTTGSREESESGRWKQPSAWFITNSRGSITGAHSGSRWPEERNTATHPQGPCAQQTLSQTQVLNQTRLQQTTVTLEYRTKLVLKMNGWMERFWTSILPDFKRVFIGKHWSKVKNNLTFIQYLESQDNYEGVKKIKIKKGC